MSEPLVSIIIPFWNNERYLNAAIQSVLGQTYAALDVVLVDDGSTDGSGQLARQHVPPARYVRRENGGAGAARNIGIEHAAAPFVAFCDADDLWAAEKLERQMASFRDDPTFDVVFSSVTEFWDAGRPSLALREARARMLGALPSAMLIRREALDRVGPFSERLRVGEWADWYIRMREAGLKEAWLPDVLVARRLHESNNGLVQGAARTEYATILRARLHRGRGGRV